MAVRKKVVDSQESHGSIDLAPNLERVKEAIRQLPHEEETMNTETSTASESGTTPTAAKKAAPKKKAVAKKTPAKAKANGKTNGEAGTTLATIAKSLKMEPRKARRILRGAEGVPEAGSRWTWTKAADVAKVKRILGAATAE